MAFVMTSLKRSKSGAYTARKGVPKDVRAEYQKLYGPAWEAQFHVPPGTPLASAKSQFNDWLADIECRVAAIRAASRGEGRELTVRQARALAGEWYRWFISRHEDQPGDPQSWWWDKIGYVDKLREFAPASFLDNPDSDPAWDWSKESEARAQIRPVVADAAQTAQFLASKGLVLSEAARGLLLDAIEPEYFEAVTLLGRRAEGDYAPDERLKRFPAFTETPVSTTGETCWQLFERWVAAKQPAASTVNRWRAVFLNLEKTFAGRAAASITMAEANTWKDGLIGGARTARTVAAVWVMAARTVFAWSETQHLLTSSPFAQVKVTVPKKIRHRETEAFTSDEVKIILKAALAVSDTKRPFAAATRWVPWLCAYTGARAGEMTQLRGADVIQREKVQALRLTPEAGSIKTGKPRTVPLHEHLIEQGFLEYVRTEGPGPLFYNDHGKKRRASDDPTNPSRSRSVKTRERLAAWVRSIGVTDKEVQPNHAWRDTFKQVAERHGISERTSDEITGHAPATAGRGYGRGTLEDHAKALKKFPRYEVKD